MQLLLIIFISFLFVSCTTVSYPPRLAEDPKNYSSQEYQECVDKNPSDKTKCELLKPNTMEPNLTEHKWKEGYH